MPGANPWGVFSSNPFFEEEKQSVVPLLFRFTQYFYPKPVLKEKDLHAGVCESLPWLRSSDQCIFANFLSNLLSNNQKKPFVVRTGDLCVQDVLTTYIMRLIINGFKDCVRFGQSLEVTVGDRRFKFFQEDCLTADGFKATVTDYSGVVIIFCKELKDINPREFDGFEHKQMSDEAISACAMKLAQAQLTEKELSGLITQIIDPSQTEWMDARLNVRVFIEKFCEAMQAILDERSSNKIFLSKN